MPKEASIPSPFGMGADDRGNDRHLIFLFLDNFKGHSKESPNAAEEGE